MKLARCITGFDKNTEDLTWTHYLTNFSIESYGRFYCLDDDSQMFLCYPITEDNKAEIETLAGVELDLGRYDYFLECGTTNDPDVPGEPLGNLDETTGYPPPLEPPPWIDDATPAVPKARHEDLD